MAATTDPSAAKAQAAQAARDKKLAAARAEAEKQMALRTEAAAERRDLVQAHQKAQEDLADCNRRIKEHDAKLKAAWAEIRALGG